jgi:hypothetical protein
MKRAQLLTLIIIGFFSMELLSQPTISGNERVALTANIAKGPIEIDGLLDEQDWRNASLATPFLNKWPMDSGYAEAKTEVKVIYSNEAVYVSAVNYQKKSDLVIQTLKRDQEDSFWGSEAFVVLLDPMNQKTMGFLFGVNAGGSQYEASVNIQGSWSRSNENWDNKWFSAVKVYDDRWVVEMAIPFTALRFKEGSSDWGLNFVRADMKHNVYSTWSHVPVQLNGIDLGYLGTLSFADGLAARQSKITLIPYASGALTKDFEGGQESETQLSTGIDAKISLSSSLNLDLTYKPDFSNVEVDRQVTNVTRFSIFFPERRNFFLENADLFSNYGSWLVRPFFSRKIGIQDGEAIPIRMGARITGNITKSLRVGIMDIQTEATDEFSANNYFLASLQQNVLKRSTVKFFLSNRQTNKTVEGDNADTFNRTAGVEFQYLSLNGRLMSAARVNMAATPEGLSNNEYLSAQANYNSGKFYVGALLERVGENYVNDVGFIPRLYNYDALRDTTIRIGHSTINSWFGLLIRPGKYGINVIEPNTWSVVNYRTNGQFLERNTSVNLSISFKNTSEFFIEALNTDSHLPVPTDIIDSDIPLPVDRYRFTQYTVKFTSDKRKKLSGDIGFTSGGFYNGTRVEWGGSVNTRFQPWGNFGISYLRNDIVLLDEYGSADFTLIGPRMEISFRNNLWWTTFLQYNTQAENFNINSRLQWRFKPMSDLFIVYTDNYATTNMIVKNRGLVVKLTYWLNL